MASSPLQQIPSSSVDAAGLSVSTAHKVLGDPRPGAIYNPLTLAAVHPVHFHPTTNTSIGGGDFLMLSSQRWTAGTPSAADPAAYTAHTVDNSPSWFGVNAATGGITGIGPGPAIPIKTAGTVNTLKAAVSRGIDYLWTLIDVDGAAVVQHWHNNPAINTLVHRSEETIPTATNSAEDDPIVFSAGLQWNANTTPYMYAYGIGATTGNVYVARKSWARVGATGSFTKPQDSQWEFLHATGYSPDATLAQPVQSSIGPLTSSGPLSFAHYGMKRAQGGVNGGFTGYDFLSVVVADGSARKAQIYTSLGGRPWTPNGDLVDLGVVGSTYLGGTLQFHPNVGPNPAMVDPVNSASAIPYSVATAVVAGSDHSIGVTWGLTQIKRHQ